MESFESMEGYVLKKEINFKKNSAKAIVGLIAFVLVFLLVIVGSRFEALDFGFYGIEEIILPIIILIAGTAFVMFLRSVLYKIVFKKINGESLIKRKEYLLLILVPFSVVFLVVLILNVIFSEYFFWPFYAMQTVNIICFIKNFYTLILCLIYGEEPLIDYDKKVIKFYVPKRKEG